MKLMILAVGKGRGGPEATLVQNWLGRLPQGGELVEVESKYPDNAKRMGDESQRLMRAIPDGARLVALDPRGRDHSSEELASLIGTWRDEGIGTICFAVGGADGHDETLRQRADKVISLGRATWPHMLFRAMLAEQLYRATSILSGHPYHRPS